MGPGFGGQGDFGAYLEQQQEPDQGGVENKNSKGKEKNQRKMTVLLLGLWSVYIRRTLYGYKVHYNHPIN